MGNLSPKELRQQIREGKWTKQTSGLCPGYAQVNLVVLPQKYAYDFLLFAQRNTAPIPLLEVTEAGERLLRNIAKGADIATDYPKYRIYREGKLVAEPFDVSEYWQEDFVSFQIGCSFSFEEELSNAGIPIRHIDENKNVPMYVTNIPCEPAGVFSGNMVVSMRPVHFSMVAKAVSVTAGMPKVHGAPVHIGTPDEIGIQNIEKPDFGDAVTINPGEVPVFWPCGVTPQVAVMNAKPDICITHAPGHMLVTDIRNTSLKY